MRLVGLKLFSANDAALVAHLVNLFSCRVGVARLHVARGRFKLVQVAHALDKGAGGDVDVTQDVERQAVEGENKGKVAEVGDELAEVDKEVNVEDEDGLVFPGQVVARVDPVDDKLGTGGPAIHAENHVL